MEKTTEKAPVKVSNVTALFVTKKSIYKELLIDCYDADRNALNYPGSNPVICHPPCRAWGRLWKQSKHPIEELELARFSVKQCRLYGGVLEHPAYSKLWKDQNLPYPGQGVDAYGGYSIDIDQFWFGHRAPKRTWVYIVGISATHLPIIPLRFEDHTHVIGRNSRMKGKPHQKKEVNKSEREKTPRSFALFLIEICSSINKTQVKDVK